MHARRAQEFELIARLYGDIEVGPEGEWIVIKCWQLVCGWNMTETPVLILVPPGYPVTPPDNFCAHPELRPSGTTNLPGNTSANQTQVGRTWLQFSYHVESGDWRPHADVLQGDNLMTFLTGVARRLSEVN